MAPTDDPNTFLEPSHEYLIPCKDPHWYLEIVQIRLTLGPMFVKPKCVSYNMIFISMLHFSVACYF